MTMLMMLIIIIIEMVVMLMMMTIMEKVMQKCEYIYTDMREREREREIWRVRESEIDREK